MRLRFGTKLALLFVPLILFPFGGLGYFWYSSTRAELEDQIREDLKARLRQVGLRLRPFLRERQMDLQDIASSPALEDYQVQLDYRLIEEAEVARKKLAEYLHVFASRRRDFVARVRYLDEHGFEVVAVTPEGIRKDRGDRSGLSLFRQARESKPGVALTPVVERSEALGADLLRLGLPIHDRWNEFRGLVVLDISMGYFYGALAQAMAGRQGTTFLADADGTILGPPHAGEALRAQWSGASDLPAKILRTKEHDQAIDLVHLENEERALLVHAPVGALGWSVGVLSPLAETEARVSALTRFTLTYGAVAAMALAAVAGLLAGGAGRRVRRLQAAAAEVARGNFALRLPTEGHDELGELAGSFNTMVESLARRDADVQARTEEAQRRRQELEVLNAVIHAAHTSLNLGESLEAILDSLLALFQFRSGAVRLLDPEADKLVLAAHRGLRPSYVADPIPLRPGEGHIGRAVAAGSPMVFNDACDLAELQERVAEGVQARGALFIPVMAKGQPLGGIALAADRPLSFTDAELNLLASIGLEIGSAIENARLFSQTQALLREAEQHRARAEALAEIGRAVTATLDLDRVLDLLVDRTRETMRADAAGILRLEDETLLYLRSQGLSATYVERFSLKLGEGIGGLAARDRKPIWTADVLGDPRLQGHAIVEAQQREGIRAVLVAPILLGEKVYGILSVFHRSAHEFARQEVEFAAAVAQQAAIAIQNAQLFQQEQERRRQVETVRTIVEEITRELDLSVLLQLIQRRATELVGATSGTIFLWDDGAKVLVPQVSSGLGEWAQDIRMRLGEGVSGTVAERRQGLLVQDYRSWPSAHPVYLERSKVTAVIAEPLLYHDRLVGVITLNDDGAGRVFTPKDQESVALLAAHAAIAISNARLYAEAATKGLRLETLNRLAARVTSSLEPEQVLNAVTRAAAELFGDAGANLWLWEEDGETLALRADISRHPEMRAATRLRPGEGAVGWIVQERRPLIIEDVHHDPRVRNSAWMRAEGFRALAGVPLLAGDHCLGALCVNRRSPAPFSPEEMDLMASLGAHAAFAIENARLYAETRKAYDDLRAAQEQLVRSEKLRALGEMAAGVAHDFNNQLTGILGKAQLLKARIRDADVREALDVIERAAVDGAETVRRILGFARAGGEQPSESVEVETLLRQVAEVARPRWKDEALARGAVIDVRVLVDPVPHMRGNPAELREVFLNLLFNAVDALPTGGTITLSARHTPGGRENEERGGAVEVFVRDTGVGMPEEVRRRAFDPFFTTKGIRGTGLGLSMAYGIICRHGGNIDIATREGAGTTVTVRLPAAGPEAARRPEPTPAAAAPARILVLDDEQMLADLLAEMLGMQGHSAVALTDPHLTLARLEAEGADLLFTDLGMPDLSGWDVAARARALRPELPVILVTGWGHQIEPEQVAAAGVTAVVAKPYRLDDIRQAVASAIKPQPQPA